MSEQNTIKSSLVADVRLIDDNWPPLEKLKMDCGNTPSWMLNNLLLQPCYITRCTIMAPLGLSIEYRQTVVVCRAAHRLTVNGKLQFLYPFNCYI